MDLDTIAEIVARPDASSLSEWRDGDGWLGGGTWLFSEPQLDLVRLIDLDGFGWTPLELTGDALRVAATCKMRELHAFPRPDDWAAGALIDQCCNALLGSFKVWNMATVGGNLCLSLPAGPMTALAAALGGTCVIWAPGGTERRVAAADFVTGDRRNVLTRGELLRSIELPLAGLRSRSAFRQASLTPGGRSAALLIGLEAPDGGFALTVTAATARPVRLVFEALPESGALRAAIERAIPDTLYHDDIYGHPDWRRRLTFHLAEEIRGELGS
ncbi:MAG TPA: FAD binding domain-containing protein [Hansschlegelia sp.]